MAEKIAARTPGIEPPQLKQYRESKGLAPVKERIVQFVRRFCAEHGICPTYEEIALGIGWVETSRTNAKTYCDELIAEGWLKKSSPLARERFIMPVDPPPAKHYPS